MVSLTSILVGGAATILLPLVSAQSTTKPANATVTGATVSLYLGGADQQPLVASVISANPSVTAYHIACAPGTDGSDCGFGPGANITVSSGSIYDFTLTDGSDFSLSYKCTWQGSAICAQTVGGAAANDPGSTSETIPAASASLSPVIITAGQEKLSAAATATSSGASKTGASKSGSGTAAASSTNAPNSATGLKTGYAMTLLGLMSFLFTQF
jgi:hypothetical protein